MLDLPLTFTDTILKPARLCVITRTDGEVIRIAEAQTDLVVDGDTYSPLAGFQLSAVKTQVGGESDSLQIDAAMTVGGTFDTYEVVDGKFDYATVEIFVTNKATLTSAGRVFKGFIGTLSFGALHNSVSFNVQGYSVRAKWPFSWTFGPMCRTQLGSKLCRIPLRPPLVQRGVTYTASSIANGYNIPFVRVSNNDTEDPETFDNKYFECTTGGTSHASVQPSYSFTIGNTTTDGAAVFICRNAWNRYAEVASIVSEFNFTLDREPDPRAVNGWFNQGGFRMFDGYSAGRSFEIGNWTQSTKMITTYLPLGAANNSTLIAVGDKLEIWRGCDFTIATCSGVFANSLNFRGEPYFLGAAAAGGQIISPSSSPPLPATPPLAALSNVTGAWSFSRQVVSGYGGSFYAATGGNITTLYDQSGAGRNFTAPGGSYVPAAETTFGGRAAGYFAGPGIFPSHMPSGLPISTFITSSEGYIVVSFWITNAANPAPAVPDYNNPCVFGDANGRMGIHTRDNNTSAYNNDGVADYGNVIAANEEIPLVAEWIHSGGTITGRVNGGTPVSSASGNTDNMSGGFNLAVSAPLGGTNLQCKIAEMVTFNVVPSSTQRDALVANMMAWVGA